MIAGLQLLLFYLCAAMMLACGSHNSEFSGNIKTVNLPKPANENERNRSLQAQNSQLQNDEANNEAKNNEDSSTDEDSNTADDAPSTRWSLPLQATVGEIVQLRLDIENEQVGSSVYLTMQSCATGKLQLFAAVGKTHLVATASDVFFSGVAEGRVGEDVDFMIINRAGNNTAPASSCTLQAEITNADGQVHTTLTKTVEITAGIGTTLYSTKIYRSGGPWFFLYGNASAISANTGRPALLFLIENNLTPTHNSAITTKRYHLAGWLPEAISINFGGGFAVGGTNPVLCQFNSPRTDCKQISNWNENITSIPVVAWLVPDGNGYQIQRAVVAPIR